MTIGIARGTRIKRTHTMTGASENILEWLARASHREVIALLRYMQQAAQIEGTRHDTTERMSASSAGINRRFSRARENMEGSGT